MSKSGFSTKSLSSAGGYSAGPCNCKSWRSALSDTASFWPSGSNFRREKARRKKVVCACRHKKSFEKRHSYATRIRSIARMAGRWSRFAPANDTWRCAGGWCRSFVRRNRPSADDLADETLNRAARTLGADRGHRHAAAGPLLLRRGPLRDARGHPQRAKTDAARRHADRRSVADRAPSAWSGPMKKARARAAARVLGSLSRAAAPWTSAS